MGSVGGWNPARAQVGKVRGVIEDGQLFAAAATEWLVLAAGVAGFGARPDVQPAAVTMVSRISARHRRRIGQAYARRSFRSAQRSVALWDELEGDEGDDRWPTQQRPGRQMPTWA